MTKKRCVRKRRRKKYGGSGSGYWNGRDQSLEQKIRRELTRLALTSKKTSTRLHYRDRLNAFRGEKLPKRVVQLDRDERKGWFREVGSRFREWFRGLR